jgi:hypothetical protein
MISLPLLQKEELVIIHALVEGLDIQPLIAEYALLDVQHAWKINHVLVAL